MKTNIPEIEILNICEIKKKEQFSSEKNNEDNHVKTEQQKFFDLTSNPLKMAEFMNSLNNQAPNNPNFHFAQPLNNQNLFNNQFNNIFKNINNYSQMNKNLINQQNMINYHQNLVNQMNNYNYSQLLNLSGNNYTQYDINNFQPQPQHESFNNTLPNNNNNNFYLNQNVQSFILQITKLIEMFTQINIKNQTQSSTLLNNLSSLIMMIGNQQHKESDLNSINVISSSLEEAKKQIVNIIQYSNYQKIIIQNLTKQLDIVFEQIAFSSGGFKQPVGISNQSNGYGSIMGNGVDNVMSGYTDHPTLFKNTNDLDNFKNY
jgi:hypothetical protein